MVVHKTTDTKLKEAIEKKLKENGGYCPCQDVKNADSRCMCKEFRDKLTERKSYTCHCGLYIIEED